jgi:DNA-binding LytR/AlgR family response regulator
VQRESIRNCVDKVSDLQLVGSYSNAIEARLFLQKREVDLIFLDVEMPEMSGLEFLENFKDVPQVIMITSNKDYAFKAFEFDVTDYLSKPVDMDRFSSAVQRVRYYEENLKRQKKEDHIFVKSDGILVKIKTNDIYYVEAMGDYIKVHTPEKRHVVHSTMKAFVAKLPEDFVRTHKSYIVNLHHIDKVEENTVYLKDEELPVSRNNRRPLIEKVQEYRAR